MHTPKIYLLTIMLLTCSNTFSFWNYNAGSSISGTIESNTNTFTHDGSYYALSSIIITNTTFNGSGLLEAPNIIISTDNFNFTGTIRCHETCIIYTPTPIDQSKITMKGSGTLICINNLKEFKEKTQQLQSQFSVEPIKNFVIEYPQQHPIQVGILAIIATVGAVKYGNGYFK